VENENSQVRNWHPTPTPLLFKSILRKRVFSKLQVEVSSSSYDFDDSTNRALPLAGERATQVNDPAPGELGLDPEDELEDELEIEDFDNILPYIPYSFRRSPC